MIVYVTRDTFDAVEVWNQRPTMGIIVTGCAGSRILGLKRLGEDVKVGEIVEFDIQETPFDKVWVSRDGDGHVDVWSKEPRCTSGPTFVGQDTAFGDLASRYKSGTVENLRLLQLIEDQIGLPDPEEYWEVTLKGGIHVC